MTASRLVDSLGTTDALAAIFSDEAVLEAMLDFEVALARAAGRAGAIPARAADIIARAASVRDLDPAAIAREARASGTPAIPFVQALRARVRAVDAESAGYVHWSATSQDVTDSAMVRLLRRALPVIAADQARLEAALRGLSGAHAGTVMLGRTLLQPAVPITFGLKAAGWCAAIVRSWGRLADAWRDALVVQFGGAAGTRAAAGPYADAIARELASQLELSPGPPWHADRGRLGTLVTSCGVYTAALGKAARDISLLMQAEIAELSEPGGGSSSMPHKRNPSGAAVVLAAAARMPGLVAAFLSSMLHEHERSVGGGHAEWPTLAAAVQATGAAAAALAGIAEGLTVDPERMRANLDATRGVIFAERAIMILTPTVGSDAAHELVASALEGVRASGRTFGHVLRALPEAADAAGDLADLDHPERFLGDAERLRRQLLDVAAPRAGE